MIGFLHLADLHLGWQPSFLDEDQARKIQLERDGVLAEGVEYALDPKNQIDLVIIAGDLFESHEPPQKLVENTIKELNRLIAKGIHVVTVPGNHDEITYKNSVYRKEEGRWPGQLVTNPMPDLVTRLEINQEQVYIYSLAYTGGVTITSPPIKEFPRENSEGFHLGIFHGSYFQGAPNWELGARSLPLDVGELEKADYDYLALGHFHKYRDFKLDKGLGAYAGMVADKGFNDPGAGFFLVGRWQKEKGVSLEKIPFSIFPKFQKATLDLSNINDKDELVAAIDNIADPNGLIQIELKGIKSFMVDLNWLQARLHHSFHYLEINDQSYFLSGDELERLSQEKTITGFFLKRIQEKLKTAETEEEKLLLNQALTKGMWALKGGEGN